MTPIPGLNEEGMAWLATRPPEIQAVVREFPPGTRVQWADGSLAGFVVSYGEGPAGLLVSLSPVSLHEDYDLAMDQRDWVHVECLRNRQPDEVGKPFEDPNYGRGVIPEAILGDLRALSKAMDDPGVLVTTESPQLPEGTKAERSE